MEEMSTEGTPEASGQVSSGEGAGTGEASHFDRMQFDPSSLPENLRNEPSLQTFSTVDNLAKSYVNAVKKIGGNPDHLVQLPQEGESWDNFYNKIGRPETPDGYDFGDTKDPRLDFYKNATHQIGLTQDQAASMLQLYAAVEQEQTKESDKANADFAVDSQIQLKREWGANYDSKIDMAQRAFAQFSSKEFSKLMDDTGLGNHPELLKAFSKVGEMLGDEQLVVGSGRGGSMSPQQAKEEIESLYRDKEFSKSYLDKTDPNHGPASTKMDGLFRTAYPQR